MWVMCRYTFLSYTPAFCHPRVWWLILQIGDIKWPLPDSSVLWKFRRNIESLNSVLKYDLRNLMNKKRRWFQDLKCDWCQGLKCDDTKFWNIMLISRSETRYPYTHITCHMYILDSYQYLRTGEVQCELLHQSNAGVFTIYRTHNHPPKRNNVRFNCGIMSINRHN